MTTYHPEAPRSRSSTASTNGSPPTTTPTPLSPTGHRGSIFDLMFLLRRSSGSRAKLHIQRNQQAHLATKFGEGEAFLHSQHPDKEEDDTHMTREQLLAKIREKKEVIEKLRCQPWPMRRKRRTLKLAQKYLQRHESKVSKTHLYKEAIARKWKKFERWFANVSIYLIPWESKIKTIESQFGSVVSSYFTFLRWIFWVNIIITVMMLAFVVIPETLADTLTSRLSDPNKTDIYAQRKKLTPDKLEKADEIQVIWDYGGYIGVSPLFYGYYSNETWLTEEFQYRLPLSYFLVTLLVLGYSFFAILRKMAANARSNKMTSGKTEQYPFSWKISSGWDYSIGVAETATNAVMANVMKFRESIMEYKEKQKEKFQVILFLRRVLANLIILGMIGLSTFLIKTVVDRSITLADSSNASDLEKNEVPIVVSIITLVYPNIFELIGNLLERFHPRVALRLQLGRILALYLLNFYTLIFALISKMEYYEKKQLEMLNRTDHGSTSAETAALVGGIMSTDDYLFKNNTLFLGADNLTDIFNLSSPLNQTFAASFASLPLGGPVSLFHFIHNYFHNQTNRANNATLKIKRIRRQTTTTNGRRQQPNVTEPYYYYATENLNAPLQLPLQGTTTIEPLTGPIQVTTINSEYGTVGVDNANAFIKENVSQDDLDQTIPLFESFPLNGTTTTPTPRVYSNLSEHIPGIPFVPFIGGLTNKIEPRPPNLMNNKDAYLFITTTTQTYQQYPIPKTSRKTAKLTAEDYEFLCWENMVGQEMCKLITMDLVMSIASILFVDFFRGLWVRYCSRWWCWSLEMFFPEYGEFKVAENVLHLINNQGMIWLGVFFAPLLPAVNNIKIIIILYIRAWALVTCNVPATQVFRASRSSNFYLLLCLLMLFLCTLPVGYVIAKKVPSKTCGPFGSHAKFYSVVTDHLPREISKNLDAVSSPGIIVPILVLLVLVIYFLVSLVRGLREANEDLQKQLIHERTEEKRKIYRMAGKRDHQERGSMALPETKRIERGHLPAKEVSRRETWHQKPLLTESMTDSSRYDEESATPSMEGYSPASPARHPIPEFNNNPFYPPLLGSSPVGLFVPSLQCLPEENRSTSSAGISEEEVESDKIKPKYSNGGGDTDATVKLLVTAPPKASIEDLTSRSTPIDSVRSITSEPTVLPVAKEKNLYRLDEEGEAQKPLKPVPFPSSPFYDKNFLSPTYALVTPSSESWPLSTYDNDSAQTSAMPTPSPSAPSGFDLSPGMLADMISPSRFSPNTFENVVKIRPYHEKDNGSQPAQPTRPKSPEVVVHVSGTGTDTDEKNRSDSGRATMEGSCSAVPGTTETDTGTESELEKFAKSRVKAAKYVPKPTPTDEQDEFELMIYDLQQPLQPTASQLMNDKNRRHFEPFSKLPDKKTVIEPMSSSFIPWPSPAEVRAGWPKPGLKHVGPPGRRDSQIDSDSQQDSPKRRPKYKISVSPSRGQRTPSSSPDSGSDRKPYIIRQTVRRSPSPGTSPLMTSSMTLPGLSNLPTKLSVIDEGIILKPKPAPRRRAGSSEMLSSESDVAVGGDNNNERLSRATTRRTSAGTNNNDGVGGDGLSSERKPYHHKSKETMI